MANEEEEKRIPTLTTETILSETGTECALDALKIVIDQGKVEAVIVLCNSLENQEFNEKVAAAFESATTGGNLEILQLVWDALGSVVKANAEQLNNLITVATQNGTPEIVDYYVQENINDAWLEANKEFYDSMLELAVNNNKGEVVVFLVRPTGPVNLENEAVMKCMTQSSSGNKGSVITKLGEIIYETERASLENEVFGGLVNAAIDANAGDAAVSLLNFVDNVTFETIKGFVLRGMGNSGASLLTSLATKVQYECDDDTMGALVEACEAGDAEVVRTFLSGCREIPQASPHIGHCILSAATKSSRHMVTSIVSAVGALSGEDGSIAAACRICAENRDIDTLRVIVRATDKIDVTQEEWGKCFTAACEPEDNPYTPFNRQRYPMLEIVTTKTGNLDINEHECVWKVLRKAVSDVNNNVIRGILEVTSSLPMNTRTGELVMSCCGNNSSNNISWVFEMLMDKVGSGNLDINNEKIGMGLFACCEQDSTRMLAVLLRTLAKCPITNKDVFRSLEKVTRESMGECVRLIVDRVDAMAMADENCGKIIHCAAMENQSHSLELILGKVNNLDFENEYVGYSIRDASKAGYNQVLTVLVGDNMLDPEDEMVGEGLKGASEAGHEDTVKYLCTRFDERFALAIPAVAEALSLLAGTGKSDAVGALLKCGSQDEFTEDDKDAISAAMKVASASASDEVLKMLVGALGEMNEETAESLVAACKEGNASSVQLLVAEQQLSLRIKAVGQAVYVAAAGNHKECLRIVVESIGYGRLSEENRFVGSAFVTAAKNGYTEIFEMLVDGMCGVNEEDKQELDLKNESVGDALHHAARSGMGECVKMIIDNVKRLDFNVPAVSNALHGASSNGFTDVIKMMTDKACLNIENNMIGAALMFASVKGFVEIVYHLVEALTRDEFGGSKVLPIKNFHVERCILACYDYDGDEYTEISRILNSHTS